MKRLTLTLILSALTTLPTIAGAQDSPPPLPQLTAEQSTRVQSEIARYRSDTEARVARGEILPDEAERLIAWREWQLAQQAAGLAPRPPVTVERTVVAPAPYYAPYYRPYYGPYSGPYYGPNYGPYYGPSAPVYWGLSFCGGGGGRHGWGSVCF